MKLTKEIIEKIVKKRPVEILKDEAIALFKLFGLQIKEFKEFINDDNSLWQTSFEIHHKRIYIINVDAGLAKAISFNNEWINFGDGCHGLSMPVENVGELVALTLNFFIEKLRVKYDGTEYDEDTFWEYEDAQEVSNLLDYTQEILSSND